MKETQEVQQVFQDTVNTISSIGKRLSIDTLKYIGISIVIFFIGLILRKMFIKYVIKLSEFIAKKTNKKLNFKIVEAFKEPVGMFFIILGSYISILCLGKGVKCDLYNNIVLNHIFNSFIIIIIALGFYNLTIEHSFLYEGICSKFNFKVDKIVFPFLSKVLRFTIITLTISVVLSEWGHNVNGFVTGLGVGGAAIAFAAKDVLANIFGGFVIILDRPFSIGDYIKTSNVEGIVEDITFRSTKIRAIDKGLVTEPNSVLSNSTIINWSKRDSRRLNFKIGITYGASKTQIKNCIDKIKNALIEDKNIVNENISVNFYEFASSSLDISIICFTKTSRYCEYLNIKEKINFKIMDIVESENLSMAFSSNSIYFENPLSISNMNNKEEDVPNENI